MLPLDVMITARTTGSLSMRWQASSSASTNPVPVSALRVSGWFSVSVTTPSSSCS